MSEIPMSELVMMHQKSILADKKLKAGLRAEELREKLDPEAIIGMMQSLLVEADTIDILELPRVKLKHEILSSILKKCMPDLRSLEVKEKDSQTTTLIIDMVKK